MNCNGYGSILQNVVYTYKIIYRIICINNLYAFIYRLILLLYKELDYV
jgi:hypothetical protein